MRKLYGDSLRSDAGFVKVIKKVAKKNAFVHLRAQLTDSPDTRWHAAHLFTRYFLEIGTSTPPSPLPRPSEVEEGPRILQGREAVTWDVAVACLSLAVKVCTDDTV